MRRRGLCEKDKENARSERQQASWQLKAEALIVSDGCGLTRARRTPAGGGAGVTSLSLCHTRLQPGY